VPPILRLSVDGGGCSGFEYAFSLGEADSLEGDRIFAKDGAKVVVDGTTYDFVAGSTVDWGDDLIRSGFEVSENPNADNTCGCKSSFAPKM
jgi:iron-sulfur cluster assembly accessory protein